MERLDRFRVPVCVTVKYNQIYEKMAQAAALGKEEIKDRAARFIFVGYVARGVQLIASDGEIEMMKRRGSDDLRSIPVLPESNLVNLKTVRRSRPVGNLKQIGITQIYVEPAEDGTPHLTIADVVAQLSPVEAARAKAFALRLKDDFVETGYLHLAQAYEFQIELFA
ncbi:MAG: hypothetical protein IJ532_00435 [Alphaproteobacteria bacterium]|nr:hypothetical protein [Alphaproteobacteria bacterium]